MFNIINKWNFFKQASLFFCFLLFCINAYSQDYNLYNWENYKVKISAKEISINNNKATLPHSVQFQKAEGKLVQISSKNKVLFITISLQNNNNNQSGIIVSENKILWNDILGLKGDPGERSGFEVLFKDLTHDNYDEVIIGKHVEGVKLCGKAELPLILTQALDITKGIFRPVLVNRLLLEGIKTEDIENITAQQTDNFEQTAKIGHVESVSSDNSSNNNPLFLIGEHFLNDGKTDRSWIEGRGGKGEFITINISPGFYKIKSIGLSFPANQAARLKKGFLLFSNKNYSFEIPDRSTDNIYWINLPAPQNSSCVSLVIDELQNSNTPLEISELYVKSELDTPEGINILKNDINDPQKSNSIIDLLSSNDDLIEKIIVPQWDKLAIEQKRHFWNIIPVETKNKFTDLGITLLGDKSVDDILKRDLARNPDGIEKIFSKLIDSSDKKNLALDLIDFIPADKAVEYLLKKRNLLNDLSGQYYSALKKSIKKQITVNPEWLPNLLNSVDDNEKIIDLLWSAASEESLDLSKNMENSLNGFDKLPFMSQYKLLEVVEQAKEGQSFKDKIKAIFQKTSDRYIKEKIILMWPKIGGDEQFLLSNTNSKIVRLRLAAIKSLDSLVNEKASVTANTVLQKLLVEDFWPVVRLAAAQSLKTTDNSFELLTQRFTAEKSQYVKKGLISVIASIQSSKKIDFLFNIINSKEMPLELKIASSESVSNNYDKSIPQNVINTFDLIKKRWDYEYIPVVVSLLKSYCLNAKQTDNNIPDFIIKLIESKSYPSLIRAEAINNLTYFPGEKTKQYINDLLIKNKNNPVLFKATKDVFNKFLNPNSFYFNF